MMMDGIKCFCKIVTCHTVIYLAVKFCTQGDYNNQVLSNA